MTVDRIKVSIEVHGYGWIGMEAAISPNEDPIECMNQLKKLVEQCSHTDYSMMGTIKATNGSQLPVTQQNKDPKEAAIDSQIEAIAGCSSLKSLEIFKKLVERENNIKLSSAYEVKRIELTNKNL